MRFDKPRNCNESPRSQDNSNVQLFFVQGPDLKWSRRGVDGGRRKRGTPRWIVGRGEAGPCLVPSPSLFGLRFSFFTAASEELLFRFLYHPKHQGVHTAFHFPCAVFRTGVQLCVRVTPDFPHEK